MNLYQRPPFKTRTLSTMIRSWGSIGLGVSLSAPALAQLPAGMDVSHGQVSAQYFDHALHLQQSSQHAITQWQHFDIGRDAQVMINQPNQNAALLARVNAGNPSQIHGQLQANGQLWVINPNGIVVGEHGQINTSGLVLSSLAISDADFLANEGIGGFAGHFAGQTGAIVNLGEIQTHNGDTLLVGTRVANHGRLLAADGDVTLAAGNEIIIQPDASRPLVINTGVTADEAAIGVHNTGLIDAVSSTLQAAGGNAYSLAVNQQGIVRATGIEHRNGRVLITADQGAVHISGEISAHHANGDGGQILIGGGHRGQDTDIVNASSVTIGTDANIDVGAADHTLGRGGDAVVWADNDTQFHGHIDARGGTGGTGGQVEVSGAWLNYSGLVDLSAHDGTAGDLLIDPVSLTIQTAGPDSPTPLDRNQPSIITVDTLQDQLALGNVTLDTTGHLENPDPATHDPADDMDGSIVVADALTWSTANRLTLSADTNVNINASINAPDGSLTVQTGERPTEASTRGQLQVSSSATLTLNEMVIDTNDNATAFVNPLPGAPRIVSGNARIDGVLNLNTLDIRLIAHADTTVSARNTANSIRSLTSSRGTRLPSIDINAGAGDLTIQGDFTVGGMSAVQNTPQSAYFRALTGGSLTLENGSRIAIERADLFTDSGEVDPIILSAGGEFVNSGATLDGRYMIFASAPDQVTKGGLTASPWYNTRYADRFGDKSGATLFDDSFAADFFPDGGRFFYTLAPTLTFTADNLQRGVDTANPALTFSVSGLVGDDTASTAWSGTPELSTTATIDSALGDYPISIADGTLSVNFNYQYTLAPGVLTVVSDQNLFVTANDIARLFGEPNPTFSARYSGFVDGDDESILDGFAISFTTTATQTSNVGTYDITPSGASSLGDYSVTYQSGTLTINQRPLTITAQDLSVFFRDDEPTYTASFDGLASFHSAADITGLTISGPEGSSLNGWLTQDVGTYTLTPSGASNTNYNISYADGTLTINPRPVTITASNASREYGLANPTFSYSISNYRGPGVSSAPADLTLTTSASSGSNVGDYAIVPSLGSDANYTYTLNNGTLQITPAPLTVSAGTYSRQYGLENPEFSASVSGLRAGDTAEAVVGTTTFSTNADVSSNTGTYNIQVNTSLLSSNYQLNTQTGTLTVTRAPLQMRIFDAERVYGDSNPEFTFELTGLRNSDDNNVITGGTWSTATSSSSVGTYAINFVSPQTDNYNVSVTPGTLTINRRDLLARPANATREYGDTNPVFTAGFEGLAGGDSAIDIIPNPGFSTIATQSTGAGNYAILLTGNATGPRASNYNIVRGQGTLSITPAPLRVVGGSQSIVYGETFDAALLNPAIIGEKFAGDVGLASIDLDGTPSQRPDAGDYTISFRLADGLPAARNYQITELVPSTLTVTPRPVSITLTNVNTTYGENFTQPVITAAGNFVPPLTGPDEPAPTGLDTWFRVESGVRQGSDAGEYQAGVTVLSPNYDVIEINGGTIQIGRRHIALKPANRTVVYGNTFNPFEMTIAGLDGLSPTDSIRDVVSSVSLYEGDNLLQLTESVDTLPAAPYILEPQINPAAHQNYVINAYPGLVVVEPRPITLRITDDNIYYRTEPNRQLTLEAQGLPSFAPDPNILFGGEWTYRIADQRHDPAQQRLPDTDYFSMVPNLLDDNQFTIQFPSRESPEQAPPDAPGPLQIPALQSTWANQITLNGTIDLRTGARIQPSTVLEYLWVQPDLEAYVDRYGNNPNYLVTVASVNVQARVDGSEETTRDIEFSLREEAARRALLEPPPEGWNTPEPIRIAGLDYETMPVMVDAMLDFLSGSGDEATEWLAEINADFGKADGEPLTRAEALVWLYENYQDPEAYAMLSTSLATYATDVLPNLSGDALTPAAAALRADLSTRLARHQSYVAGSVRARVNQWLAEQQAERENNTTPGLVTLFDFSGDPPYQEFIADALGEHAAAVMEQRMTDTSVGTGAAIIGGSGAVLTGAVLFASASAFMHVVPTVGASVMASVGAAGVGMVLAGPAVAAGFVLVVGSMAATQVADMIVSREAYEEVMNNIGTPWENVSFSDDPGDDVNAAMNRTLAGLALADLVSGVPLDSYFDRIY